MGPGKEMAAATVGPKLDTGYKGAAGDRSETKNCTQTKASCWQQDMKIRMINSPTLKK